MNRNGSIVRATWRSFRLLERRARAEFLGIVLWRVTLNFLDVLGLVSIGFLATVAAGELSDRKSVELGPFELDLGTSTPLAYLVIASASFFVLKSALSVLLLRVTTRFLAVQEGHASAKASRRLFNQSLGKLENYSKGELQWITSRSAAVAITGILFSASTILTELTLFAFVMGTIFLFSPSLALIVLLYFSLIVLTFQFAIKGNLAKLGNRLKSHGVITSNKILDLTEAFREIAALGKKEHFIRGYATSRMLQAIDGGKNRFVLGLPRYFVETGLVLAFLLIALWQILSSNPVESAGLAGIAVAGGTRLIAALIPVQNAISDIRINAPQAESAQELLLSVINESGARPDLDYCQATEVDKSAGLNVVLDGVSFSYEKDGPRALEDLTITFEALTHSAIVGPSGAGKTTLVEILLGLQVPDEGTVKIGNLTPTDLARAAPGSIAYLPQSPAMVSGSIAENVALGVPIEQIDRLRVVELLEAVGLAELTKNSTNGIDTFLGQQRNALSRGQLQRIGLARAIYPHPKLIVLDEPTSSLDADTEETIVSVIRSLRRGATVISVAHRLSTVEDADMVLVLDKGSVVARGSMNQLEQESAIVRRYFNRLER